ncbi:hypothetical protein HGE1_04737 [Anaplasma phagocytophilum str. HGE1]|nr:hypothetical protein YYU_05080 [Anaplasma phagocytophilum str. HZ2]AGR80897.1 hypothetical protein WSQ_05120 [Anaplasma phagocytophilum str. JM]AGR82152.1 hypothetical protein YYY_05125 [Anaplasma phagocytophilum str. Dog2]EOA61330.1 hypothetical protein HGE1_04737 [Anaplasma phagocytophilum str. HGE1]KDB56357.1 hypothetical protein O997_05125 [Anaplasma phagocytophilum str. MRK]PLC10097.1 hypothetical protein C0V68_03010 [Anaplasma phagocytophilum]
MCLVHRASGAVCSGCDVCAFQVKNRSCAFGLLKRALHMHGKDVIDPEKYSASCAEVWRFCVA